MSDPTTFDRATLLRWADEHHKDAEIHRERAAYYADRAREADRKAALCERDAAEMPEGPAQPEG